MNAIVTARPAATGKYDVIVVGAGFAGLYLLHRLRGMGLSVLVLERGDGIGGTWYWNRYPGCRCDTESIQYSYSFSDELQQEWSWSERYASQPEILRYLNHVADRFDLRRDIRLGVNVEAAAFDDASGLWSVTTDGGAYLARFCVMATGILSTSRVPQIDGVDAFRGEVYHTGRWPSEGADLAGKRVAVIGTGSSGIQAIPRIAEVAREVVVFQRTPNYSLPAQNRPADRSIEAEWKSEYAARRKRARETTPGGMIYEFGRQSALDVDPAGFQAELERRWAMGGPAFLYAFTDLLTNARANELAAEFVRGKIRAIVRDPAMAEKLVPTDYPIGSKRICVDTDYFATFNRANVSLVDIRATPIERIEAEGVRVDGRLHPVDVIAFATGFDAMTGALSRIDLRGRRGVSLGERWKEGPVNYLGLMCAGFPNLFTVVGPGSPIVGNVVVSIENHVEWIAGCLGFMDDHGIAEIEPTPEAEAEWQAHLSELARGTLFDRADSWFNGGNIEGKARVLLPYPGRYDDYRRKIFGVARDGYAGFRLSRRENSRPMAAEESLQRPG